MLNEDLNLLRQMMIDDNLDTAEKMVVKMHRRYHLHPISHARIHLVWGRIAALRQNYLKAAGQWIVALAFAIPVSLWQKYFGQRLSGRY